MTEYVVLHALTHHRQEPYLRACQREKRWEPRSQWAANAISLGVMGLGTVGADAADALRRVGFRVFGWSINPRQIDGIDCDDGVAQLEIFLHRTYLLVSLLPLPPHIRSTLNRALI